MKKFFNVMKFFVTDEFFLFCLMVVFVFGTIAVINLHALFAVGYNDCIAFSALLYSLLSVVFLVIGIVTTLYMRLRKIMRIMSTSRI